MGWKTSLRHQFRVLRYSVLMALRSMRHRSFRTFLTVLGILIGITTFTALMSVGVGMKTEITQILGQFAGASMVVMSKISSSRPSIPGSVAGYLEQIDGINFTTGMITDFGDVNGEGVMLSGVESEKMLFLLGLKIVEGMDLKDAEAAGITRPCVIDTDAQQKLGIRVNETIIVTSSLSGIVMELTVVGVVESLGFGDMGPMGGGMSGMVHLELVTLQEILVTTNVQVIMVGLEDGAADDAVADAIREVYPEAQVITEEEILAMMDQIVGIINGVLLALSAISLVVGALMIMSTMTMSVLERTREIGIMKSIGAKRTHVLTIFLTEAFLISLVGGVLGSLAAVGAILGLDQIMAGSYGFSMPFSFEPWIFITGMLLAVGIGLASGAYPSWQAASVKPVEALRYE